MNIEHGREIGKKWYRDRIESTAGPYEKFRLRSSAWRRPTLHLEDVSAIPFVNVIPGVEQYQHRARVRASTGDLFAAVTPIPEGYEAYCRDELGLGSPQLLMAEPVDSPMAVTRACMDGTAFSKLVDWARQEEDVVLHPYMSIADVWELARRLHEASGANVEVAGPPPPTLWIANDKWSLHAVITEVCGEDWLAESTAVATFDDAVRLLTEFSSRYDRVGMKRTRCASAMGNRVFASEVFQRLSENSRVDLVRRFATDVEWEEGEDVLVVEWIDSVASPSTQVWIPPVGQGDPVVEGVYEQILEGEEQVFVGSRPSTLDPRVNESIATASAAVSAAFQEMGYVGRCSFDFVLGRSPHGDIDALFTECNGRWGGTSTPMHLVDRLFDERPHYVAQDWQDDSLVGMSFEDLYEALDDLLWRPDRPDGRFVLYNVGPLAGDGKFDVISLGESPEDAWTGVEHILSERLLG